MGVSAREDGENGEDVAGFCGEYEGVYESGGGGIEKGREDGGREESDKAASVWGAETEFWIGAKKEGLCICGVLKRSDEDAVRGIRRDAGEIGGRE